MSYKPFLLLVEEAVSKMENESLYQRFKTNQSFRFKVVNILKYNGYLVHGTDTDFDSFDPSKIKGGTRGNYGYGAYFTDASYKCEEFGTEFVFVSRKGMNFLELDETVANKNVMAEKNKNISTLQSKIDEYEQGLYNSVNVRDYNFYEKGLKKCKEMLKNEVPDSGTEIFIGQYNKLINQNPGIDYHNLTKKLSNIFSNGLGVGFVEKMFLNLGYDGYHIDNEYVIFNFEKLNANIVKDKEGLLRQLMGNKDT